MPGILKGYEAGDVYTKKGLDDDSYVVYSCLYYICQGIDTKVPALAEFYVVKDTDGTGRLTALLTMTATR